MESEVSKYVYVVHRLGRSGCISENSELFRLIKEEDHLNLIASVRILASKTFHQTAKDRLAGCPFGTYKRRELEAILKELGLNPDAEENPDPLDDNPVVARNSWKLQHGVSLVLRLLFVACFVLAAYAVATGDDQGVTEKFVEPALYGLWKHSEEFVEPVLYRLYKRLVQHEIRDLFEEQLAVYQAKVQEETQKVEEQLAIYQAKVQEETLKVEKLAANQDKLAANHGELAANQDKLAANHGELDANQTVLKEGVEKLAADQEELAANQEKLAADQEELAANHGELAKNQTVLEQNISALFEQLKAMSQLGHLSDWLDVMQIAMRLCPNCSETFLYWVKTLVYAFMSCTFFEKMGTKMGIERWKLPLHEYVHGVRVYTKFALMYVLLFIVVIHAFEIWNGMINFWNSAGENWNKIVEIWNDMIKLYNSLSNLWSWGCMGLAVFTFLRNFGLV